MTDLCLKQGPGLSDQAAPSTPHPRICRIPLSLETWAKVIYTERTARKMDSSSNIMKYRNVFYNSLPGTSQVPNRTNVQ